MENRKWIMDDCLHPRMGTYYIPSSLIYPSFVLHAVGRLVLFREAFVHTFAQIQRLYSLRRILSLAVIVRPKDGI